MGRIKTKNTGLLPLQVCGKLWRGDRLGVFICHGDGVGGSADGLGGKGGGEEM